MNFLVAAMAAFFGAFLLVPFVLGIAQMFGLYTIVRERQCQVFVQIGRASCRERV